MSGGLFKHSRVTKTRVAEALISGISAAFYELQEEREAEKKGKEEDGEKEEGEKQEKDMPTQKSEDTAQDKTGGQGGVEAAGEKGVASEEEGVLEEEKGKRLLPHVNFAFDEDVFHLAYKRMQQPAPARLSRRHESSMAAASGGGAGDGPGGAGDAEKGVVGVSEDGGKGVGGADREMIED